MTKIRHIYFRNYRAFLGDKNKIEVNSKNLLIYGENGSGKSSLYLGLKDFFDAFGITSASAEDPTHLKARNKNDYEVKVSFSSPIKSLVFKGNPVTDNLIGDTFRLNSFLSYKEMLETHFLKKDEQFEEKFYKLLTTTLLSNYEIENTTIGKTLEELEEKLLEAPKNEELLKQLQEKGEEFDEEDLEVVDKQGEIEKFKTLFDKALNEISPELNKILDFFNQEIKVKFKELQLTFDEQENKLKGSLGLDVNYIGVDDINHLEILNEARLSALAISIYLAAIVKNPLVQKAKYKILFLDDVFIGLDTSNRLPLLNILQDFEIKIKLYDENGVETGEVDRKIFEDFQIFITTYDRYWFEVAKRKLQTQEKWNFFEMYAVKKRTAKGKFICEIPVIKLSDSNIANALKHINNPISPDYPAAANYLRKANEGIIKENLSARELKKDSGEPHDPPLSLNELMTIATKFLEKLHFDTSLLKDMKKEHLKTLLNPLSHFEIDTPIYKGELEDILELTKKIEQYLKGLKSKYKLILTRGSELKFRFGLPDINPTEEGFFEMKIKEDLYLCRTSVGNKISNVDFFVVKCNSTSNTAFVNVPNANNDWTSIENGYERSFDFLRFGANPSVIRVANYIDVTEFKDKNGAWQPLNSIANF